MNLKGITDSQRVVVMTSGNINDLANMCGRFDITEEDLDELQDYFYETLPEDTRCIAFFDEGPMKDADKTFEYTNGVLSIKLV